MEEDARIPSEPQAWDDERHYHGHEHGHGHGHDHGGQDAANQLAERRVLQRALAAFVGYRRHAQATNQRRKNEWMLVPAGHRALLPDYAAELEAVDQAIEKNAQFLALVASNALMFADPDDQHAMLAQSAAEHGRPLVRESDMDKVNSTLKQAVRDWTAEGKEERDATYAPIMAALAEQYGDMAPENRAQIRVLVPGAGLGRLAYDIAKAGYSCQGNEFSYHMLFMSSYLLNRVEAAKQHIIYPFIHSFSNIVSKRDILTPVGVPDVLPGGLPHNVDFSMVAGDFLEVYADKDQQESWDCVATCYFIDTAHNIIEYMDTVRSILKPGGLWINYGPLLYHWEGTPGERSIELSLEQVKQVACKMGFTIESERMHTSTYAANPQAMLKYAYNCGFFVARKSASVPAETGVDPAPAV
ncbi:N2227-like protein-domain-containing protein [Thamnocephalis sphaerospora]|uniref:carnosine N-methyltransferase n=1 Tax=Thamnocephalis sphaerospora TaxID=78915 RepID=A0A4P9XMH7_9FUNG|nr:N2227-like protein-domain-containing protein [Thamnocephalis sphaerospora]|eukprot:RKP07108.1 N2227-like protein-domain-containing protein [Thamnocephalis sphaerospora]